MFVKKRVLLVTNGFPFGESERGFLSAEAKKLAEQFDLYVLAPENADELRYPADDIVRIDRYRYSSFRKTRDWCGLLRILRMSTFREAWALARAHHFSNPIGDLRQTLYFRFNAWEMEKKIGELVETEKIDLVYTYWCCEYAVGAVYLKERFPDLKVVTRFHGMDLYQERRKDGWQPFRNEVARLADGLCFACEHGRTYFMEHWGAEYARKMHIFYLGSTDRGVLEVPQGEKLQMISCSNLIPLKRVDLIIEGLALLPDTIQVEWNHFGDGAQREALEGIAREKLQNHPNIQWKFHGFVPNSMLAEEYRAIKPQVFITTSSTEGGAPVSIQEAFSMGIPAIGTAIGGIPDLVLDGETGYLLPQQAKAADVAEAVAKFAALSGEEKQKMAAAARKRWTEKFDAVENAAQFAAYLRDLIPQ